jgi:hypothetical protein
MNECRLKVAGNEQVLLQVGISVRSAGNCCLVLFFVDVKNYSLALFVVLELKQKVLLQMRFKMSAPLAAILLL